MQPIQVQTHSTSAGTWLRDLLCKCLDQRQAWQANMPEVQHQPSSPAGSAEWSFALYFPGADSQDAPDATRWFLYHPRPFLFSPNLRGQTHLGSGKLDHLDQRDQMYLIGCWWERSRLDHRFLREPSSPIRIS